jgi:hypothetical protein
VAPQDAAADAILSADLPIFWIKRRDQLPMDERSQTREALAEDILHLAMRTRGGLRPRTKRRVVPAADPWADAELELEESLARDPRGAKPQVSERFTDPPRVVLCLDTSQSMTGDKMKLLGVAAAMVALNSTPDRYAAVAFENEARILKTFEQPFPAPMLLGRLLEMPYKGYTHLEDGLRAALREQRPGSAVILVTDGLFTAGRDPRFLAPRLAPLHVVSLGTEESGMRFCRELASHGQGSFHHAPVLASLPTVMYSLIRQLNRRSA